MERKNILILVYTEYQLLLAAKLIHTEFADENYFNIVLIQFEIVGESRFRSSINFATLPVRNIKIEVDYENRSNNKNIRKIIEEVLTINYKKFVYFHEDCDFLSYFLTDVLSRRGTIISLGQDGLKPYTTIKGFNLHWRIRSTLKIYIFLFSNGFFIRSFNLKKNKYAYLKQTDELYLTHPEVYNNWSKKKLVKIRLDNELQEINKLKALFEFEKNGIELKDNSIFFVNQPLENLFDYEINLLGRIREKFPTATIYVKTHSQTPKSQLLSYYEITNCIIINTTIPAELYISTLNNSIIVSFWSTSLLFYNQTCSYYWLYELLLEEGILKNKMIITNPTQHINVVKSFELINFKSSVADAL